MKICRICRQPVKFESGRGFIHVGGGIYMMRCESCGAMFSPAKPTVNCPICNSRDVRDDHCVCAVDSDDMDALESVRRVAKKLQ